MKNNLLSDFKLKENIILKELYLSKISNLIDRGDFILGEEVNEFEKKFAKYCETFYSIGTSSGTSALDLAIKCFDLSSDDEVIVPALTFVSTALAVHFNKAKIVYCDIDSRSFNIDPTELAKKISPKTKIIIPVHLYGQSADMLSILEIARENDISIIEDASQSHGAICKLGNTFKKVGSIGDLGCFSFYPTKNLGALGDAGAIVTNNEIFNEKLKALRNYGQYKKNEHSLLGDNARLDTIQAIVLNEKLGMLDNLNMKRQEVASWYHECLSGIDHIKLPEQMSYSTHVFHQFVIRSKFRDEIKQELSKNHIEVGVHYPRPMHLHHCFKFLGYNIGDFKEAEKACSEILSLPISPFMTMKDVEIVSDIIKTTLENS